MVPADAPIDPALAIIARFQELAACNGNEPAAVCGTGDFLDEPSNDTSRSFRVAIRLRLLPSGLSGDLAPLAKPSKRSFSPCAILIIDKMVRPFKSAAAIGSRNPLWTATFCAKTSKANQQC
jgi:hypothetical protein